jgi:hypothetical protein
MRAEWLHINRIGFRESGVDFRFECCSLEM